MKEKYAGVLEALLGITIAKAGTADAAMSARFTGLNDVTMGVLVSIQPEPNLESVRSCLSLRVKSVVFQQPVSAASDASTTSCNISHQLKATYLKKPSQR